MPITWLFLGSEQLPITSTGSRKLWLPAHFPKCWTIPERFCKIQHPLVSMTTKAHTGCAIKNVLNVIKVLLLWTVDTLWCEFTFPASTHFNVPEKWKEYHTFHTSWAPYLGTCVCTAYLVFAMGVKSCSLCVLHFKETRSLTDELCKRSC